MNSKELVAQATAKIEKMCNLTDKIEAIENILKVSGENTEIALYEAGVGTNRLCLVLSEEVAEELKNSAIDKIRRALEDNTTELKQILGTKLEPEQVITVMKNCITGETKVEINDKSLDKYPAKKKAKKSPYPENMTPDLVRKMYVDEGKTLKQVAEYFELKPSQVNGFLIKHKLFRGSYNKSLGQSPPEPLRAQSDTEKCRICGKEIQFSAKMTREMWPYKYKRKQDGKEQMMYGCNREHYYAGKTKDA